MSAHPETRYVCDRCKTDAVVPLSNGPVHQRVGGPDNWLQLGVGTDPSRAPVHLCPSCRALFEAFMSELKT